MATDSSSEGSEVLSPGVRTKSDNQIRMSFTQTISENLKQNTESLKALAKSSETRRKRYRDSSGESEAEGSKSPPQKNAAMTPSRSSARPSGLTKEACSYSEGQRLPARLSSCTQGTQVSQPVGSDQETALEQSSLGNPLAKVSKSNPEKGKSMVKRSSTSNAQVEEEEDEESALGELERLFDAGDSSLGGDPGVGSSFPILRGADLPTWHPSKEVLE